MHRIQRLVLVALLFSIAGPAIGQTQNPSETTTPTVDTAPPQTSPTAENADNSTTADTGDGPTETVQSESPTATASPAGTDAEIDALKQEMAAMKAEYDSRLEELEFGEVEDEVAEVSERNFRIFGFYDMSVLWRHIGDDSFFNEGDGFVNTSPQFLMQHLNLYFSSQLTRTVSFLTELQFTFLPNGGTSGSFQEPEQQDTNVVDPNTQQQYRLGGVILQRAWLKWEPFQFLGIKAGYFLTPYGIWHEDHASTVRISILPPFENDTVTPTAIAGTKPLPASQLGLQLYGRVFPSDSLRFDYAFTVSNGRGFADTVIDYDKNKGLGLRLKLTYKGRNVEIAAGGYGYFGEYTDMIFANYNEEILENYMEYAVATDLLISFFGVRLQAEYIRRIIRYSDEGRPLTSLFQGVDNFYAPDTVTSLVYSLLAYQLPLDKWLNGMTLTPYVGVEFDMPRDDLEFFKVLVFNFGLNYKPITFVSLKAEGSRMSVDWFGDTTASIWTVAGQVAISF